MMYFTSIDIRMKGPTKLRIVLDVAKLCLYFPWYLVAKYLNFLNNHLPPSVKVCL